MTEYSEKYRDSRYEFRHITLSRNDYDRLPRDYLEFYDAENSRARNMMAIS